MSYQTPSPCDGCFYKSLRCYLRCEKDEKDPLIPKYEGSEVVE